MLDTANMSLEFNARKLDIGASILNKLGSFPPSIWLNIESEIAMEMQTRAAQISSASVSEKTYQWRKSRRKKGKKVETHNGVMKLPNDSRNIGDRTHTFLTDLENSQEPGVRTSIGTHLGAMVVENGSFMYQIDADKFANDYPNIFQDYLVQKGLLPQGGFLDLDKAVEDRLIKELEDAVWREIKVKLGAYGGAASMAKTVIVSAKKLFGRLFGRK